MKNIYTGSADISLFHVAAKLCGDPLCWWRVLEINQLTDYNLSHLDQNVDLKIPDKPDFVGTGLPVEVAVV
nr:hypothetical protein [uncultured Neokomagataea sp.]